MTRVVTNFKNKAQPHKTLTSLCFDNSYARLPKIFHSAHTVSPLQNSCLLHFNARAAKLINLPHNTAASDNFLDTITGITPLPEFTPIACCYAGHQFGHFVPRLGDGRALLLGEVKNDNGSRWDLQLKGSGQTLYSRSGDGRAVLRSSIREYLCSAAMHGLGIGTSHVLCLIGSEEEVYRERIETGAMIVRMSPSHIRFGTFEYFYYAQRYDDLQLLTNYVLQTHFPHLLDTENPTLALLGEVIESTAKLIAQWQSVGFMHGVMNTDNMSIHGITLDYGPFGFMEAFNPSEICNHSDHSGRYAFDRQPEVALFNLSCFAQTLVPLIGSTSEKSAELATAMLHNFQPRYTQYYIDLMRAKLGLAIAAEADQNLCDGLLQAMQKNRVDFTRFFRALSVADTQLRSTGTRTLFANPDACDGWMRQYTQRLECESRTATERSDDMLRINPKFVLRNYMAEVAIRKVEDENDNSEIDRLMTLLASPFAEHPEMAHYAHSPPDWASRLSVSCSS